MGAKRPHLAAVAVAAVLLAIGALASPSLAQGKPLRGVNLTPFRAFMPGGQSDAEDQAEIQGACRLGAGLVREFVSWPMLEPSRGQVDPAYVARLDSLMGQASACGIRVMFMLAATPPWDSSAPAGTGWPKSGTYAPRDAELRWMVAWILRRWPSLHSIEVWNEPNYSPYWSGTAAEYAGMVNQAVAAKRDAGSSTLILAGALASGAVDFLNQAYAAGMSGQDGISLHPYSWYCSAGCTLTNPSPATAPFRAAIARIHNLMVQRGDRGGVWLTEFGFASCPAAPSCVPESLQAQWTVKSVRIASCYPYVRGMTPFTIRDIPGTPQTSGVIDAHFGLLRTDFSPKPVYGALASAYRAKPGERGCRRLVGRDP